MTTAQRTQRPMTPNEYRYWWERASDEEIIEAQHPDDYEAEYRQAQQAQPRRQAAQRSQAPARGQERQAQPQEVPAKKAMWALGITLLAFGGIGWIFGGMFTLDGWISWFNTIMAIVRLPLAIPEAAGLWRLLFIPLAVIYSRVETKHRPVWRDEKKRWHVEKPLFWVGFILITITDIGSTAAGLQTTDPNAWGVLQPTVASITKSGWAVGGVATVLTFAPEWAMLGGIWLLKR